MREQHELSKAFPPMSEEEFQILKDSIENIGVQTPIVIFEDKVIDGWHRYTAAMEVGLPCPEVDLADDVDPRDFVLANNKARRHLTKSQLALSYSKVYQWNPSSKKSRGEPGSPHKTNQELAEMVGTSARTIQQAKTVLSKGDKAVVEAVETGKISVKRGSQIAKLPKEQQESAITAPPEPKPSILDGNEPSDDELKANEMSMQADLQAVADFLDADDKMAVIWEENKKLRFLNSQLEVRNAALMREKNECIKLCKKQQVQLDKFYKAQK
jgi:ParB-like chromosome segregation protein Spo0J